MDAKVTPEARKPSGVEWTINRSLHYFDCRAKLEEIKVNYRLCKAIQKMKELTHKQQQTRLEVDIESNPMESSFTRQLLELMHREEFMSQHEGFSPQLEKRIETLMAREIKAHTRAQSDLNLRRWGSLFERQREDREQMAREIQDKIKATKEEERGYTDPGGGAGSLGVGGMSRTPSNGWVSSGDTAVEAGTECPEVGGSLSVKRNTDPYQASSRVLSTMHRRRWIVSLSPEQFAERELDMRHEMETNWAEYERFNLNNAFQLQLRKLEHIDTGDSKIVHEDRTTPPGCSQRGKPPSRKMDWSVHEEKMQQEFDTYKASIRAQILGEKRDQCPEALIPGMGNSLGGGLSPWHNSEKQSRLIHTAPTFTPDEGGGLGSTRGRSPRGSSRFGRDTSRQSRGSRRRDLREWRGRGRGASKGGRGGRGERGSARAQAEERELERLEEAFKNGKCKVAEQKRVAQRWIRRQGIRMQAQIEVLGEEHRHRLECSKEAKRKMDSMVALVSSIKKPEV